MIRSQHRALLIPEMVREITKWFQLNEDNGMTEFNLDRRQAQRLELLNQALTCALFSQICLDFLWRKMTSLDPLLLLLPKIQVVDCELVRLMMLFGLTP